MTPNNNRLRELSTLIVIRDAMLCAVLLALAALLGFLARAAASIPEEIRQTRADVLATVDRRLGLLQQSVMTEVHTQADGLQEQITAARNDVVGLATDQLDTLQKQLLFGQVQAFRAIHVATEHANERLNDTNMIAAGAVLSLQDATQHASVLMDTYASLPANLYASPEWAAIRPEITCREADGAGYGGCWHSRITALMGEAANVGGVFTKKFPAMADAATRTGDSIAHISDSIDKLYFGKKTFWQQVKGTIGLVTGGVRAGSAVGAFDVQVAPNPFAVTK